MYLKGGYFYEGNVHVPLIVNWQSGFRRGAVVDAPVELVDLAPTLLDACGLPPCKGMQGKSLYPYLSGKTEVCRPHDNVCCEYYKTDMDGEAVAFCTMLFDGRYKLTKVHKLTEKLADGFRGELYDLVTDPAERYNLYDDPAHAAVKLRLLEALCDREALTADPLPVMRAPW